MYVVFRDMSAENLYLVRVTDFSDEISDSRAKATGEDWFTVLRGPDQVIFAVEDGVGGFAVEFHLPALAS